jgi:hypothetical protein
MFTELPKLLDRNFAVGFFLPAAWLGGGLWMVLGLHGLVSLPATLDELGNLTNAVLAIFLVWLLAIGLLALNYPLLRLLEGYPLLRLFQLLGRWVPAGREWFERRLRLRFERRAKQALALQAAIDLARAEGRGEPAIPADHARRLRYVAECLPAEAEHVLPTRLGNLFRAFEVYPNVLYNLDAIPAWPRLQAVIPEHFRQILADAKAQLDFCVNLVTGGVLVTLAHLGLALWYWQLPGPWLILLGIAAAILGYQLALSAAAQFGGYVKSAFDLYRGDLARNLGLELPRLVEAERIMWRTVSRMMIYRSAARAGELTRFRGHRKNNH